MLKIYNIFEIFKICSQKFFSNILTQVFWDPPPRMNSGILKDPQESPGIPKIMKILKNSSRVIEEHEKDGFSLAILIFRTASSGH